jgi:hypothetical protein
MNVDQNIYQIHNNIEEVSIHDYTKKTIHHHFFFFLYISGASFNKIDDDNISIMAPHQSCFDEYPSGTGKIIL